MDKDKLSILLKHAADLEVDLKKLERIQKSTEDAPIFVDPYAQHIHSKKKTLIITPEPLPSQLTADPILFSDGANVYGRLHITNSKPISLTEFRKKDSEHLLSDQQRKDWWPTKRRLYAHTFNITDLYTDIISIEEQQDSTETLTKSAAYADLPSIEGPTEAVWQNHFNGSNVHGDLRIKADSHLIGYTLAYQKPSKIANIDNLELATEINSSFHPAGSRWNKSMVTPSKIFATVKERRSLQWLDIDKEMFEPGSIGATRFKSGIIITHSRPTVSYGDRTNSFHEYFMEKSQGMEGRLVFHRLVGEYDLEDADKTKSDIPFWTATFSKKLMPTILTKAAVQTGRIPPQNWALLPPKLKSVVPVRFRYWLAQDPNERREIRDALVAEGFFTNKNIHLVDGEFRRTVTRYYLYEPPIEDLEANAKEDNPFIKLKNEPNLPDGMYGKLLKFWDTYSELLPNAIKPEENTTNIEPHGPPSAIQDIKEIEVCQQKSEHHDEKIVKYKTSTDEGHNHTALIDHNTGNGVTTINNDHKHLVENLKVLEAHDHSHTLLMDEEAKTFKMEMIAKQEDEDERYVLGVVLVPEEVDSQGDIYDKATVRKASEYFMEYARTLGLMHETALDETRVKILENYIAPCDFNINGQQVTEGTWLLAARIIDDELWEDIKEGRITGWSIEGYAIAQHV